MANPNISTIPVFDPAYFTGGTYSVINNLPQVNGSDNVATITNTNTASWMNSTSFYAVNFIQFVFQGTFLSGSKDTVFHFGVGDEEFIAGQNALGLAGNAIYNVVSVNSAGTGIQIDQGYCVNGTQTPSTGANYAYPTYAALTDNSPILMRLSYGSPSWVASWSVNLSGSAPRSFWANINVDTLPIPMTAMAFYATAVNTSDTTSHSISLSRLNLTYAQAESQASARATPSYMRQGGATARATAATSATGSAAPWPELVFRSDNFNRANGSLGANWSNDAISTAGMTITDDELSTPGATNYYGSVYTQQPFEADQYSQIWINPNSVTNSGSYIGVGVRGNNYIAIIWNNGGTPTLATYYWNGSGYSEGEIVGAVTIPTEGAPLAIIVQGSEISCTFNGAENGSFSNTTYTTGQPGVVGYGPATAENWVGGGLDPIGLVDAITDSSTGIEQYICFDPNNSPASDSLTANQPLVRIKQPDSPAAGVPHKFLFILPVTYGPDTTNEGGPDTGGTFGLGLETVMATNFHNTENCTLVEPQFVINPWYADCDAAALNSSHYQFETFVTEHLVPLVQQMFGNNTEQNWLIGFSRSGLGGSALLFKHPDIFDRGAFWDSPFDQVDWKNDTAPNTTDSDGQNYGSDANFQANYKLSSANITNWIDGTDFKTRERIWIDGYVAFQQDLTDYQALLTTLGVQYGVGTVEAWPKHAWDAGWVSNALTALSAMPNAATGGSSASAFFALF